MDKLLKRAAQISLIINLLLFILKGVVGVISNSIAVISDAINSLTDVVSSGVILYSVKVSLKKPDEEHQFGHNAAQPIAVFLIALFAGIVGIEIIKESVTRIINPAEVHISLPVYIVLLLTIITKMVLMRYQSSAGKEYKSPGLRASAVDSLNDVLASAVSLIGVIGSQLGLLYVDGIAGIIISLFIFRSGYVIARENIDYLMGKSASDQVVLEIARRAMSVNGVKGFNDLRSHYVGDKFHIEIHIEVDKNLTTEESHDIGNKVKFSIEDMNEIQKVFVHLDPV